MAGVESQVAVHAQMLSDLREEIQRLRGRVHELRAIEEGVRLLRTSVSELHDELPNLARQAAREAVTEMLRRRHADWYTNLRTYAAVASAGVAFGALVVALLIR